MARKKAVPQQLAQEIATTRDGRDITQPYISELQEARDPLLFQSVDWGVYDKIFRDDQVKSTWQQRVGAVVSREWNVIAGGDAPIDKEAADALNQNLVDIGLDRTTEKMLKAVFNGYSVAEMLWGYREKDGLIGFTGIKVRNARRFRYDKDGAFRMLTRQNMRGELLPPKKFWIVTAGADDDDEVYGRGLAYWLYWPTLFKRNGVKFWQTFLDKFGTPTAKATYRQGTPKEEIDKGLQALAAIATDSGIMVPDGFVIELLEASRSGTADFATMVRYMDGAIAKIILSQTMTTDDGASLSQAKVHADVKLEVVKADADLLCESFNQGPAVWWRDMNFPGAAVPKLQRLVDEEEDLGQTAETDTKLDKLGWRRTDESFRDTYGDGYERKPEPKPDPNAPPKPGDIVADNKKTGDEPPIDPGKQADDDGKPREFAAGDEKTLYVSRAVENAREILAWAKKAGIQNLHPADKLHVTLAFSRARLDWMQVESAWDNRGDGKLVVPPGGARRIDEIARGGPAVLLFNDDTLRWRHKVIRDAGASWDWQDFHPHITLSDDPQVDLSAIEAWQGPIVLGPERFEELDEDWKAHAFAEAAVHTLPQLGRDDIDEAVDALLDEGWQEAMDPMLEPLLTALESATSLEDAKRIIASGVTAMSTDQLTEMLARATFAARARETVEEEEDNG